MLELVRQPEQNQDDEGARLARKWHKRIRAEKKAHDDWRKEAKAVWEIYRPTDDETRQNYPLLWSVVSIQHSAIYSSRPVPIVKTRNQERIPAHKTAADVMERGLEFITDQTVFDQTIDRMTDDYLLAGMGVPRVKLDAEIHDILVKNDMGMPVLGDDGKPMVEPVIASQDIRAEYVPWSRFGWEPVACWEHVTWEYFKHPMKASEIKKRYGDEASFGQGGDEYSSEDSAIYKEQSTYWIYEIWDASNKEVIHLAEGGQEPLEVVDDPLRISGFFPNPAPPMCNVLYDQLIPKPDYCQIESFDKDLNRLYQRARTLIEQIKAVTFHDASITELEDFASIEDGTSIAIQNIKERLEGGALDSMIIAWPIKEKVEALQHVIAQMDIRRRQVDELMGISDVLRGASNPQDGQETQKIKERWGGIRLRRKQLAIQRTIRDLYRIMGEVMVEHFTRDNLQRMTQVQIDDQAWEILQNDFMREFAVDIETDSTVAKDEFEDKQARTELLAQIGSWVQVMAPAMNANQIPADLAGEALKLAVAPYANKARGLDQVLDQLPTTQKQLQQMQQLQGQMQQQGQQIQQMQYALSQYSQAEEQRKNQKSEAELNTSRANLATAQAKIPDLQAKAGNTQADTGKTVAETQKIMLEMSQPPKTDCGCNDCQQGKACGCGAKTNEYA